MKLNITLLLALSAITFGACSDDDVDIKRPYVDYSDSNPDGDPDDGKNPSGPDQKPASNYVIMNTANEKYNFTNSVSINTSKVYQTMEGFGASDCWMAHYVGTNYTEQQRTEMARALFSQDTTANGDVLGIGLSMWRFNLGAGSAEQGDNSDITTVERRAESFVGGSGYDWSKCAGQQYFLKKAKELGCEKILMFSNSPLVQYTKNGFARSDNGSYANLKEDQYDNFAAYMADVAKHFTDEGIKVDYISPVNEPQYNWEGHDQEGSAWRNYEVAKLTKALDKQLTDKGLSTEIVVAEAGSWEYLYKDNNAGRSNQFLDFFSSSSENYIGDLEHVKPTLSAHSYYLDGSWAVMKDTRSKAYDAASKYGCSTWQTEWSMLVNGPDQYINGGEFAGFDNSKYIDISLYLSKVIHSDMVWANCASWSYWTVWGQQRWSQKNRFFLIQLSTDPITDYADNYGDVTAGGNYALNTNLYVLGNYSRFVRPGYKRIALDIEDNYQQNFFGTAYMSPDGNTVVAVYTNMTDSKIKLETNLNGFSAVKYSRYVTSETENLKRTNLSDGNTVIAPKSVVTIVYSK